MDGNKKSVILIGANGLLGKAILSSLSTKYSIIAIVRNTKSFEKCGTIKKTIAIPDFSLNSVRHMINELEAQSERVVSIINCARSLTHLSLPDHYEEQCLNFQAYLEEELLFNKILIDCSASSFPNLTSIVLTSSIYGNVVPNPALNDSTISSYPQQYGVSKSALQYLVKDFAIRLKSQNIRVNAVALGGIKGRSSLDFEGRYKSLNETSGMLEVTDCIGVYDFLISSNAQAITGQTINVDNGFTLC